MPVKKRVKVEPIPEHFASAEEAGKFWDTHDLGDYWDQTRPVEDYQCRIERRQHLVALEPALARKLADEAHQRGISSESLVNLWLSEKLQAVKKRA